LKLFSLGIIAPKIRKNGLKAKKLWPSQVEGVIFTENSQSNNSSFIFEPLKKSLNITLLPLKLQDDL
jgi:hypothetical protein